MILKEKESLFEDLNIKHSNLQEDYSKLEIKRKEKSKKSKLKMQENLNENKNIFGKEIDNWKLKCLNLEKINDELGFYIFFI